MQVRRPRALLTALGTGVALLALAGCGGSDAAGAGGETAVVTPPSSSESTPTPTPSTPAPTPAVPPPAETGDPGVPVPDRPGGVGAPEAVLTELTVRYAAAAGAPQRTWVLRCGTEPTVSGDAAGVDAKAACEQLARHAANGVDPFAPTPKDQPCTMVYGGSDVAKVSGVWDGRKVSASFTKVDGCEIARWITLGPLLPNTPQVPPPAR